MKFSIVISFLFILFFSAILSSGTHLGGSFGHQSGVRTISDVFRAPVGNFRSKQISYVPSYGRDLFDVHCYDTTGIKISVYDDCWNSPRTTDIVIRNRDETSRINSRRFSLYDTLGGTELIEGYSDVFDSNALVSPNGLGLHCFDTAGVRIAYDNCWTSPRTRNILLTRKGTDMRLNSRRFGVTSTYYGGDSLIPYRDEVEDCYCVTQDRYYGDNRGILYVKMRPEYSFTADIRTRLLGLNWADLDGCVPYDVVEVPYLPSVSYDYRMPYF